MKPRRALLGLLVAFPCLYVSSALLGSAPGSALALLFVAGLCAYLLLPDGSGQA